MNGRLLAALAASLAIIVGAPYLGELRAAIQRALPGQYRTIIGGIVVVAVVVAVAAALVRIRERRLLRYGLLAASVTGAAVYAALMRTGNADVDVVELFHFVEYGAVTYLFYRACHGRDDVGAIALPVLGGLMVGTLDEFFQWYIPLRVGELHDVLLNCAAIVCGLVFSLGLEPPVRLRALPSGRGSIVFAGALAAAVATVALFVQLVHLGFEIRDPKAGTFRSASSADDLGHAQQDRAARWSTAPPLVARRVSREDQYLAEGLWHVQRRNQLASIDPWAAWKENLILEAYYRPVLDFPSYATPNGARWPDEQRSAVAAQVAGDRRAYVSDAHPYPIYLWRPGVFWLVVVSVAGGIVVLCARCGRTDGRRTVVRT